MPTNSRLTTMLASYLFLSSAPTAELAAKTTSPGALGARIRETDQALGTDAARIAARETAYEYGDHPETAAPRWAAALTAAARVDTAALQQRAGGAR